MQGNESGFLLSFSAPLYPIRRTVSSIVCGDYLTRIKFDTVVCHGTISVRLKHGWKLPKLNLNLWQVGVSAEAYREGHLIRRINSK